MPDSEPELSPLCDADPLARALARLRPAPSAVDPARVVFLAGQAHQAADAAFWKRMFAAQCVLSGGLAAALTAFLVVSIEPDERVIAVPKAPPPRIAPKEQAPPPHPAPRSYPEEPDPFTPPVGGANTAELAEYLRVRREVLAAGLGLLPESQVRPRPPVDAAELEQSLHLPPGVLADHYPLARPRPKASAVPE